MFSMQSGHPSELASVPPIYLDVIEYIEIASARLSSVILYNPSDAKGGRSGTALHEVCDGSQDLYVTLYAIWKRSYDEPKITVTGYRANSQGNPDDEGTYLQVNINWSIYDSTIAGESANSATITVSCNNVSTTLTPTGTSSNNWISSNNTSTLLNANLNKDTKYNATIVLTDKGGSSHSKTIILFVPTAFYPIDILPGGTGIAFGGASTAQGKMEMFYDDVLLGFDEDTTSDLYKAINTLGWISEVIV